MSNSEEKWSGFSWKVSNVFEPFQSNVFVRIRGRYKQLFISFAVIIKTRTSVSLCLMMLNEQQSRHSWRAKTCHGNMYSTWTVSKVYLIEQSAKDVLTYSDL